VDTDLFVVLDDERDDVDDEQGQEQEDQPELRLPGLAQLLRVELPADAHGRESS